VRPLELRRPIGRPNRRGWLGAVAGAAAPSHSHLRARAIGGHRGPDGRGGNACGQQLYSKVVFFGAGTTNQPMANKHTAPKSPGGEGWGRADIVLKSIFFLQNLSFQKNQSFETFLVKVHEEMKDMRWIQNRKGN